MSCGKFSRYVEEEDMRVFLQALHETALFVRIKSRFKVVKSDPDDDIILRAAYDSKADYIVSGDKHLLSLSEFKGIRIVTIEEILKILRKNRFEIIFFDGTN